MNILNNVTIIFELKVLDNSTFNRKTDMFQFDVFESIAPK